MPLMSDHEEFLNATMLDDGDVVVLLDEGVFREPEETGLSRTVFQIRVGLPDQRTKTWTMNKTTRKKLAEEYGDDSANWVNKTVKVTITKQNVRGEMRDVLYGAPFTGKNPFKLVGAAKNTEKLMSQILEAQPNITETELESMVQEEIAKAAGLLTEEAATYMVARELGIEFTA